MLRVTLVSWWKVVTEFGGVAFLSIRSPTINVTFNLVELRWNDGVDPRDVKGSDMRFKWES